MPLIQLTDITLYPAESLPQVVDKVGAGFFSRFGLRPKPEEDRYHIPLNPPPTPILDNLTLTIRHHETLALLGPSGSGKSTLIKIVAGLVKPYSGTISYNGQDMADVPPRERRIGMVFQQQALYQNMTSEENIGFYYELRKQPELIPQRIRDVSRLMDVDLEPLLARRPPKLSGGERQRVAIARALAREVDIFLFDEPLSHLDPPLRNHLRGSIHRVFIKHPVTTIYVTHDQMEAMALADRVAIMRAGRIEQIGTTAELIQRPRNTFVADFFGSCNLLPGFIRGDRWQLGDVIVSPPPAKAHEGDRVTLGVRPVDFDVADEGLMQVRVLDVVPLYDRRVNLIQGRVEGQELTIELPQETELQETIAVNPTRVHWFDTKSGVRLPF